ncbi:ABC transporter substrate-binding protein [Paenibacillus rigui]|uniref:ABC transporter substrate-binding protein n=1 Tax=Paenibacillus rigui TaxID=554312 RepID=A0A229UP16_9BACL|nr:ABC transporter substrate-binding protein [Paenibacillus rigui]OXM85093.1 ABC transporter substrate-binding protein [Paenibacillus rigui]
MKMNRRAGMLLCAIMLVAAAVGCGKEDKKPAAPTAAPVVESKSAEKPPEMKTVRFSEVIRSIFYAPHYIAMEKGFFKEAGINIDMNTAQGSDKGAAALLAGAADISLVGPETAIYIFNQKGDKTLKIFHQLTFKDGSFLLSRNKMNTFKWSDLEGKNIIGWRPGSAPQMVLNSKLIQEKVAKADVVTNIASTAMAGAFTSGKGDFIQVFEPIASTLEKEGKAYYVASMGEGFGQFPETSYVATADYLKNNADTVQRFSNALVKATQWLDTASKDEIAAALAPYFEGTPKDIIIQSVERYKKQGTWNANPELTAVQFDTLQHVLIENGVLKAEQKVKMEDVVDMTFAKKAGK